MDRRSACLAFLAAALGPARADVIVGDELSPPEAHRLAAAGLIILVDVRRPDEWLETGVPEHAHPLQMDHPLFFEKLEALVSARRGKPVVLICQAGVRTKALQQKMREIGYRDIAHVAGGVAGFGADKGWVGYKLPLVEGP